MEDHISNEGMIQLYHTSKNHIASIFTLQHWNINEEPGENV